MPQLEMYQAVANSPSTTLAIGINAIDTQITLVDVSVLPEAPNILVLGYDTNYPETCLYTSIVGNVVTLERGTEGVATVFNIGTKVARVFTAKDYNIVINNIKDLNNKQIALSIVLG